MKTNLNKGLKLSLPKETNSNTLITVIICGLFLLLTKTGFSQSPVCNYQIENSLECTVIVQIDYYDCSSHTICSTLTHTFTGAGSWSPSCSCSPPNPLCNIVVTIITVANFALLSGVGSVDNGTLYSSSDSGTTVSCNSGTSYQMHWNWNSTAITY